MLDKKISGLDLRDYSQLTDETIITILINNVNYKTTLGELRKQILFNKQIGENVTGAIATVDGLQEITNKNFIEPDLNGSPISALVNGLHINYLTNLSENVQAAIDQLRGADELLVTQVDDLVSYRNENEYIRFYDEMMSNVSGEIKVTAANINTDAISIENVLVSIFELTDTTSRKVISSATISIDSDSSDTKKLNEINISSLLTEKSYAIIIDYKLYNE